MELGLKIFQFILSISILVFLHELGHFLPAKWFKTRAEKFFLFFDPWFSLFSMKKINGKWQYKFLSKNQPDTEVVEINGEKKEVPINIENLPENDWRKHPESTKWGIGWLPMGGYVKIAGMVDESMDTEQLKKPAQPWEFRSKPAWQRLIIMVGGVTVNFFLAWFIFSCLSFFGNEKFHSNAKFEGGIAVSAEGEKMGLKTGDKILKIDGKPAERFETSLVNLLFANDVTVMRNGKEHTFPINEDGVAEVLKASEAQIYMTARFPAVVDSVMPKSTAESIKLEKGDKIIALNHQPIKYFDELSSGLKTLKNKKTTITIDRKGQIIEKEISVNAEGLLGFIVDGKEAEKAFSATEVVQKYTFAQAIPRGFERTIDALVMQVKQFKIIFNSKTKGYKKVSGPIGIIGKMPVKKELNSNGQADLSIDWVLFWGFTAMFSVWLAFLNLLPIPGLDGGHIMFTLWEMITGKPVPQKVLENAQMIGVIFLLGLMILIFGNDIVKLFLGKL